MANERLYPGTAANQATVSSTYDIAGFTKQAGQWQPWTTFNYKKSQPVKRPQIHRTLAGGVKLQGIRTIRWVFDSMDWYMLDYIIDTYFAGDEYQTTATVSVMVKTEKRSTKYYVCTLTNPLIAIQQSRQAESIDNVEFYFEVVSEISS